MKLGGNRPPGDNPLLFFDKWHGILYMPSCPRPVAQTRLDIPMPLITQSWNTGGGGVSQNVQFHEWDPNRQHIQRRVQDFWIGGGGRDWREPKDKKTPVGSIFIRNFHSRFYHTDIY